MYIRIYTYILEWRYSSRILSFCNIWTYFIYVSFHDAVNNPAYIVLNNRIIMNEDLEGMREKGAVACFKVLTWNSPGGTEEAARTRMSRQFCVPVKVVTDQHGMWGVSGMLNVPTSLPRLLLNARLFGIRSGLDVVEKLDGLNFC
jgi:hypothetical protein